MADILHVIYISVLFVAGYIAAHEAGHIVVARMLGYKVRLGIIRRGWMIGSITLSLEGPAVCAENIEKVFRLACTFVLDLFMINVGALVPSLAYIYLMECLGVLSDAAATILVYAAMEYFIFEVYYSVMRLRQQATRIVCGKP
ncbi:MAG: hypothetical protein DRO09_00405 [Thermoprotei archaeon]|nr:MAG: hypothetical protein DRO09_00405 [Thermoprotei archaeon]